MKYDPNRPGFNKTIIFTSYYGNRKMSLYKQSYLCSVTHLKRTCLNTEGQYNIFVMACANSFAKDCLRSPSCDHKETMGRFFYPFRLIYLCSDLLGECSLNWELPDHFVYLFNSRKLLLIFLDTRVHLYCH